MLLAQRVQTVKKQTTPVRGAQALPHLPQRLSASCRRGTALDASCSTRRARLTPICSAQAGTEEQKETNLQAWNSQVQDGRVRNVSAQDVKSMQAEGWVVLDVRPPYEAEKAPVANSVQVPLFVGDPSNEPASQLKKLTDFAMGGWWLGGTHNVPNENFSEEVKQKLSPDTKVIVVCQKGLRSLAACETIARLGFNNIAWVNGGLDSARKGDIDTANGVDVRYGGVGGMSEALGWTEVQREEGKEEAFGGLLGIIKFAGVILAIDMLVFAYEQIQVMTGSKM